MSRDLKDKKIETTVSSDLLKLRTVRTMSASFTEITTPPNRSAEKTKRKRVFTATNSPMRKRTKPLQDLVAGEMSQVLSQSLVSPRIRSLRQDEVGEVNYDDTCEELFNLLDAMETKIIARKRIMRQKGYTSLMQPEKSTKNFEEVVSFLEEKCEKLENELIEMTSENDDLKKQLTNVREILETLMVDYFKTKSFMENVVQERDQLDREIQILNATLNIRSNVSRNCNEISTPDFGKNKSLNSKIREYHSAKEELIIAQEKFKLIEEDVRKLVGLKFELNRASKRRSLNRDSKSPHFYVKDICPQDQSAYVNVTLTDEEINETSIDQLDGVNDVNPWRVNWLKSTSGYDCSTPKRTSSSRKVRFAPGLECPALQFGQSPVRAKPNRSETSHSRQLSDVFIKDE